MTAVATDRVPTRAEVPVADTWDLASLFPSDAAWEKAFAEWEGMIGRYAEFRGTLGTSPEALATCLRFDIDFERRGDRWHSADALAMAVALAPGGVLEAAERPLVVELDGRLPGWPEWAPARPIRSPSTTTRTSTSWSARTAA